MKDYMTLSHFFCELKESLIMEWKEGVVRDR